MDILDLFKGWSSVLGTLGLLIGTFVGLIFTRERHHDDRQANLTNSAVAFAEELRANLTRLEERLTQRDDQIAALEATRSASEDRMRALEHGYALMRLEVLQLRSAYQALLDRYETVAAYVRSLPEAPEHIKSLLSSSPQPLPPAGDPGFVPPLTTP